MRRRFFLLAMTAFLLVLFLTGVHVQFGRAQGQTYYVDPSGSDLTGDGSIGSPWRTIQHAADQVTAGDTVLINPGQYSGGITVETGGTASNPITFRGNGPGAIIEGSGGVRDAFFITEADYVVVEGLTIQHANRAGVRISLSHHVTVRDCTLANNVTWGVFTDFSDYTLVENCESYGAGEEHGIYISNSSDYPTIRGNRLHDNSGCGLHMNGDLSMGGDGIISHALVEDNIIYGNGESGGSGINMDGVTFSIVRNNLLYNNHAGGISLYQIDGGSGSHDNRVLNNTILMPSDGRWAINVASDQETNTKLFNNIVYNAHSFRGGISIATPALAGFESDYNIVMNRFSTDTGDTLLTLAQWRALGYDTHSVIATPAQLFVNPGESDYHLRVGSPAINAGMFLADVTTDLDGNPRPSGLTHDAGAYEYQEAVGNRAPLMPFNPAPADSAADVPTDAILTWQGGDPDGDPVTYTVAFGIADPPPVVTSVTQLLYTPSLLTDTTYYWQITASDGLSTTVGPMWQFTTANQEPDNRAPVTPFNPHPADNAAVPPADVTLTWQNGDPDGDPVTYTVAFGIVNPPPVVATVTQPLYVAELFTGTTDYPTYYWRITASDGLSTTVGPVWRFTIFSGGYWHLYLPLVLRQWGGAASGPAPQIEGCQIYPADHIWNASVDTLPVDAHSTAYINTIGATVGFHADFGSGDWPEGSGSPIGIPFMTVPGTQPKVAVVFDYDDESDPGPYPIPSNAPIEGGPGSDGDRHVLVLDRDHCILYEMYNSWPQTDGSWEAGSGAVFDLSTYPLRPDGWTSADAAGLPILPGLVRYDEVAAGEIRHAIRFTANQTRREYIWPARHYASSLTSSQYPPMGQRFRLKADFDVSGFSAEIQVILRAMKTYGIILADNGSDWYISGVPDERWDNDMLHELGQVRGADFEAVDVSSLMLNEDSGQVQP